MSSNLTLSAIKKTARKGGFCDSVAIYFLKDMRSKNDFKKCALCKKVSILQMSHLFPSFAIKWLKETSPNGYMRQVVNPNLRKQDASKKELLCFDCEQLFSKYEKYFAENIFLPWINTGPKQFQQNENLKKFVVSLHWRLSLGDPGLPEVSFPQKIYIKRYLNSARLYLLGKAADLPYEHHVFFLDKIAQISEGTEVPPRFHQYLLRSVDATPVLDMKRRFFPKTIWHFVKLPHIVFVTFIKPEPGIKANWIDTKIENHGILQTKQEIRDGRFGGFLVDRATSSHRMFQDGLSQNQREVMAETAKRDLEKFVHSKTFEAYLADKKIGSSYKEDF